jgi:NTE family protein
VDYRIMEQPGRRILLIEPREKSWGPDYLRFGLGFATDFRSDNPFNVLASYRKTWLNRLGGEWLTEAQIGSDPRLFTELYQPVHEAGRYFVAPYASIGQSTRGIFLNEDRIAEYRILEGRLGLDAGASVSTWGESRLGLLWRRIDASVETGSPVLPELEETTAGVRARLLADHMDDAWFPRAGHRAVVSAYQATSRLGSDRSYRRLEGELSVAASWGPHTLNVNVAAGTDLGTNLPAYEAFSLGGPLRLSGFRIGEIAGSSMAFARLMYYNRTLPLPDLLGSGVYAGVSLEAGRVRDNIAGLPDSGTLYSGSIFLGASTFLGPAYFGFGYGEGGRKSVFLLLGIP